MLELNIGNFVTVGIISAAMWAAIQFFCAQFNIHIPYITN